MPTEPSWAGDGAATTTTNAAASASRAKIGAIILSPLVLRVAGRPAPERGVMLASRRRPRHARPAARDRDAGRAGMAKRRIALVGLGMAVTPHAKSLVDLAARAEVAAAYSPSAARRASSRADSPSR